MSLCHLCAHMTKNSTGNYYQNPTHYGIRWLGVSVTMAPELKQYLPKILKILYCFMYILNTLSDWEGVRGSGAPIIWLILNFPQNQHENEENWAEGKGGGGTHRPSYGIYTLLGTGSGYGTRTGSNGFLNIMRTVHTAPEPAQEPGPENWQMGFGPIFPYLILIPGVCCNGLKMFSAVLF